MKIAIPSDDKSNVCKHFGKSKGFVICEIEDNKVKTKDYKINDFTEHAKGLTKDLEFSHDHHTDSHHHNHSHHHGHSHKGILRAIGDCRIVIAGGMGRRLYNDFEENDIRVFITQEKSVDKALDLYVKGLLDSDIDKCCNH